MRSCEQIRYHMPRRWNRCRNAIRHHNNAQIKKFAVPAPNPTPRTFAFENKRFLRTGSRRRLRSTGGTGGSRSTRGTGGSRSARSARSSTFHTRNGLLAVQVRREVAFAERAIIKNDTSHHLDRLATFRAFHGAAATTVCRSKAHEIPPSRSCPVGSSPYRTLHKP